MALVGTSACTGRAAASQRPRRRTSTACALGAGTGRGSRSLVDGRLFGGVGAHEAAPAGAAGDVDDRIGSVDVINPPALDDVVGFVSPAGRAGVDVGAELAPKPRGSLRCRAGMARSERKGA
ncbi:unnamed protein product [Prorocentrum cordatum]|uniref:Uncharacterized protein n=1 Tax=Prorocentrum cordatum TaxID=2364126 RepID=A0ABN9PKK3_9DINO|nr:unnamed protein product [Polarella glacialis]